MARRTPPPTPPINRGPVGREPCDARCPGVALVYVERADARLGFCGHCFDNRWADLFANGWAVREDLRSQLRQQEAQR